MINIKIAVFDNCAFKFSRIIIDHWKAKGHSVIAEMGSNPHWAEWADLTYIDWMDNNFYYLFNGVNGDRKPSFPKNRIALRMIDIDIWQGRHRDSTIWTYLDDCIVINQFYYDFVYKETTPHSDGKLHLIRPGVVLDQFPFVKKERGYKIAMVTGDIWEAKGVFEGIRLFQEINRLYPRKPWELHIRGQHIPPEWHTYAYDKLIENTGLADKITIHPPVDNMGVWYADKDYILVTSHKEAFSYAAAEGMAVGLKPVINNFFGAEDIWDKKYLFNSLFEASQMIGEGDWNQEEYRQFIEDKYDAERMFKEYDDLFQT